MQTEEKQTSVGDDGEIKLKNIGNGLDDSKPGFWDVSDLVYYADKSHLSCSMLMDYAKSPRLFEMKYLFEQSEEQEDNSAALFFGRAFHEAILRPEMFEKSFKIKPKFGRKKADLEAKAKWESENENAEFLSPEDFEKITGMMKSVERSGLLNISGERKIEQAARWKMAVSDNWMRPIDPNFERPEYPNCLWGKCKFDLIIDDHIFVDVKTISDIKSDSDISKHIFDFGYHIRQEWYLSGAALSGAFEKKSGDSPAVTVAKKPQYLFLFVSKKKPYDCLMTEIDFSFAALARQKIADTLKNLSQSIAMDDWRFRGEFLRSISSAPKWAFNL